MGRIEQEVRNDSHSSQFVLDFNGKRSFLKYDIRDHVIDLYHTFVPDELRGNNLGNQLVEYAIQFSKENNLKIIPTCPFVKKYFAKHPELSGMLIS